MLGPGFLRDARRPFGLPGFTTRKQVQTAVSTTLFIMTMALTQALVRAGGCVLIEHFAPLDLHDQCEAASIWRIDLVRKIARHPNVALHIVEQGCFGAPSKKPTGLLAVRMPTLGDRLNQSGTLSVPKEISVGRDDSGAFKTAVFKECPPRLCRAFALVYIDSLDGAE